MMMPTLFIGHGSPMNIVVDNSFTMFLESLGRSLPKPKAILVVSAHWLAKESFVLDEASPRTIHDFGGFPDELYKVTYPAPGAVQLAQQMKDLLKDQINLTKEWGFDHGSWALLHRMYPKHDIPVTQLSLRRDLNSLQHYELAQKLKSLRQQGVLILGSGNLVHNLRHFSFEEDAPVQSWSQQVDDWMKINLTERNDENFLNPLPGLKNLWPMAHPTAEHYMPLLYALGASDRTEKVSHIYEGFQNGTISMRSVMFG